MPINKKRMFPKQYPVWWPQLRELKELIDEEKEIPESRACCDCGCNCQKSRAIVKAAEDLAKAIEEADKNAGL